MCECMKKGAESARVHFFHACHMGCVSLSCCCYRLLFLFDLCVKLSDNVLDHLLFVLSNLSERAEVSVRFLCEKNQAEGLAFLPERSISFIFSMMRTYGRQSINLM